MTVISPRQQQQELLLKRAIGSFKLKADPSCSQRSLYLWKDQGKIYPHIWILAHWKKSHFLLPHLSITNSKPDPTEQLPSHNGKSRGKERLFSPWLPLPASCREEDEGTKRGQVNKWRMRGTHFSGWGGNLVRIVLILYFCSLLFVFPLLPLKALLVKEFNFIYSGGKRKFSGIS